jgi:RES domain-containing protein
MEVYRISILKYSERLVASGLPARWNPRGIRMIYTAGTRALACLENVVHRNSTGSAEIFRTMVIEIPTLIPIEQITATDLSADWAAFHNQPITQDFGEQWARSGRSAVLRVPSAIIPEEFNYLLNPDHPHFSQIVLKETEPFVFDARIK